MWGLPMARQTLNPFTNIHYTTHTLAEIANPWKYPPKYNI